MFLYANFFSVSGVYGLFQLCIKYIDRKKKKREIQMSRECLPTIDIAYMCCWN